MLQDYRVSHTRLLHITSHHVTLLQYSVCVCVRVCVSVGGGGGGGWSGAAARIYNWGGVVMWPSNFHYIHQCHNHRNSQFL